MAKKMTQEQFIKRIEKRHGNRYDLSKAIYVNQDTPVIITCIKHDFEFEIRPKVLLGYKNKKKGIVTGNCPKCLEEYLKSKCKTNNTDPKPKRTRGNRNSLFIYIDNKKYYPCDIHGNVAVGNNRSFNRGCPSCNIENRGTVKNSKSVHRSQIPKVSYEEAKERVNRLGIISFKEYRAWIKRTNQLDMPSNPERVYQGKGWKSSFEFFNTDMSAGMSGGEKKIYLYLKRKKLDFEYEKKFDDCRNINSLRFDFYLPKYNLCVEFDGDQHFRPSGFSSDSEVNMKKFKQTQINDEIKNRYCRDNGINLLRLDNYEFDNNTIEWSLDIELINIAAELAIKELEIIRNC